MNHVINKKDAEVDLTICSNVIPLDKRHIELNWEVTTRLNTVNGWRWIVTVDNNETEGRAVEKIVTLGDERCDLVDVYDESIQEASRWGANYHHGTALNKILKKIKTRYVLFLDPDFYIVGKDWMRKILQHMQAQDLAFFGVPWHPKWYMKYRSFPCVHCFFIDLNKVPLDTLNLLPDVPQQIAPKTGRWRQSKRRVRDYMPGVVRSLWNFNRWVVLNRKSICKEWDTGSRIFLQYGNQQQFRFECPMPVFDPKEDFIGPQGAFYAFNTFLEKFLPEHLCYIPKAKESFTTSGFRDLGYPDLSSLAWEEFLWQGRPFGFHVRRYPKRNADPRQQEKQDASLPEILNQFIAAETDGAAVQVGHEI